MSFRCPKCAHELSTKESLVPTCTQCEGAWLSARRYMPSLPERTSPQDLIAHLEKDSAATQFACPSCLGGRLRATLWRGLEIDWCGNCMGLYLDRGELQQLHLGAPPKETDTVQQALGEARRVLTLELFASTLRSILRAC